jgi:hypothetical protein
VNQVLKAAMAINAQTLSEMAIPESYIEALPKVCQNELGHVCINNLIKHFYHKCL